MALGFDLASDAIRRSALERARDTGAIAISGRVELVQETQRQFGFLVILPIYRGAPWRNYSRKARSPPGIRFRRISGRGCGSGFPVGAKSG
ncbi:MAG: hypothetical protein HC840_16150 [Leptolyngbyaceae cyanobacterium RM2_2_4]|nr:hypothetical protein [Leptolyngbyaceae cyanobacterium RM2_2_4]